MSRLPFLRRLHLSFCVRLTDAGLLALAGPTAASSITSGPHKGDSSGTGHCSTSASSTVASALGGSYGTQHWGITVRRTSSGGGWEHGSVPTSLARSVSMGAQASAMQSGAELTPPHKLGSAAAGCRRLQELELYHCPQVGWAHSPACILSVVAAPRVARRACRAVVLLWPCSLVCPHLCAALQSELRQTCSSWNAAGNQTCAKPLPKVHLPLCLNLCR